MTTVGPAATKQKSESFVKVFGGVGAMSFLTYVGEYAAFIIVLVFLSDKFTVTFQLGDFGYALIGTISGVYLIASGLVAIYMGHLCDKYGRRRLMIIGCIIGAIGIMSLIVADRFTTLGPFVVATVASLVTLGMAHGTYTAATLAYGGDLAEVHETMGKAYGLVDGAEFAGYAFGPALGSTVAYALSRTAVFEMSSLMLLVAGGLAVVFMPEVGSRVVGNHEHDDDHEDDGHEVGGVDMHGHSHSATWGDYVNAFRTPIVGVALLTTLVGAVGFSAFFTFVPLYAHTLVGVVPSFALLWGYFASIMALTGVLFMVPFGHFADRSKRRMPYLVAGLVCAGVALGFIIFVPASVPSFVLGSIAYGLAIGTVRVSQLVILAEKSHPTNRAAIMGTNHAMEHVGYGLAALVTGTLVAAMGGFYGGFRAISIILAVAGLAFFLYARRAKVK